MRRWKKGVVPTKDYIGQSYMYLPVVQWESYMGQGILMANLDMAFMAWQLVNHDHYNMNFSTRIAAFWRRRIEYHSGPSVPERLYLAEFHGKDEGWERCDAIETMLWLGQSMFCANPSIALFTQHKPQIVILSVDPWFAQCNRWIMQIHALRTTYIQYTCVQLSLEVL